MKVILNYLPPGRIDQPSTSLSILQSFLKQNGIEAKTIYWNILMLPLTFYYENSHDVFRNLFPFLADVAEEFNDTAIRKKLISYLQSLKPFFKTTDNFYSNSLDEIQRNAHQLIRTELQKEGKILHVGVSNVNPAELNAAISMGNIATVENMYGHAQRRTLKTAHGEDRGGEEVLEICEKNKIPLIPYFSLINSLPKKDDRISKVAAKYNKTEAQIHLAWLLHKSAFILPIPGTSSIKHFDENCRSIEINLSEEDMHFLE